MNSATYTVQIVRSRRKTVGIQILSPTQVLVRAPLHLPAADVRRIVDEKRGWIEKHLAQVSGRDEAARQQPPLTMDEIRALANQALAFFPPRVAELARLVGVRVGLITIRNQKTRWGSCSAEGNLNFNCLLMLTPPEVIDSIVVHELCHLKEMNHSKRFYDEVLRVFPEYHKWNRWLKAHGGILLQRMADGLK